MVFWRKNKQLPVAEKTEQSRSSFLSTGSETVSEKSYLQRFEDGMRRYDLPKMKMLDSQGVAMDSVDCPAPNAFALNSVYGQMPVHQFEWYAQQSFIGYQLAAILAQQWLIGKACAMPAEDAIQPGWEISIGEDVDPAIFDQYREYNKQLNIRNHCVEFINKMRVFGIRHALFVVDSSDPLYYEKPFNPDGVKKGSYKGISQIDPYWLSPELSGNAMMDPAAMDYYEPTYWRVRGRRIHKSHFVVACNGDALPDILKPLYFYGGVPTPQKIYERVYAAERSANEAPLLAMSKRMTVMKVDTEKVMANLDVFSAEMENWVALQNNYGAKIVDHADEINQFDTALGDLDALIMTQYQLVAAAADVPSTKLLGTQPKGFNASGDYETTSYREFLQSIQENKLRQLLERHYLLLSRSHFDKKWNVGVIFNALDAPKKGDLADMNLKKSQTDETLARAGAIDAEDIRNRLINDPESGYTGIDPIVPDGPGDDELGDDNEKNET